MLEHEHFIIINSEDMLPDFDELIDAYGLFMYNPEHIDLSGRRGAGRSGGTGLVMAEKLQNFVEKYGTYMKVALLNCATYTIACDRIYKRIGVRKQRVPVYTVFGHNKQFRKLDLGRPDLNLNKIVGTHVSMMKKNVTRLDQKNIQGYLKKNINKNIVILFTNKPKPGLLYLNLANIFKDKYLFTEIHTSETKLLQQFKVKSSEVPKLFVLKDSSTYEGYFYDGKLKKKSMIIFLSKKLKQLKEENKKIGLYNKSVYETGQCGVKDSTYCLFVLSNSKKNIKWLIERLTKISTKYTSDPLKIYVLDDKDKFSTVFGDNKIVFLKGKRRKYKGKEQGLWQIKDEELENFIDMGMSGGMLQGRFKSLEDLF